MIGTLTPREQEVATLVALGYTSPKIAEKMGIHHDTVMVHMARVYVKVEIPYEKGLDRRVLLARWEWSRQLGLNPVTLEAE